MRKIVYFLVALLVTVPAFAGMPEWVANPYIDYPSNQYVAHQDLEKPRVRQSRMPSPQLPLSLE